MRLYLCSCGHLLSSLGSRVGEPRSTNGSQINKITWKMRDYVFCIIYRSERRALLLHVAIDERRPTCFEERMTCQQRSRKFLVYESMRWGGVCLLVELVWCKVRIPFVGKLETYIERAMYLPRFCLRGEVAFETRIVTIDTDKLC